MRELIKLAIKEDLSSGDVTTNCLVPNDLRVEAAIIAKEKGVIAGFEAAKEVFRRINPRVKFVPRKKDGAQAKRGDVIAIIKGPARAILSGERLALNFMQRLSGVATMSASFAAAVEGTGAQVLDTRKTTPLWRALEKKAVRSGGCFNHRFGLFDAVLIKDNHLCVEKDIERAIKKSKRFGRVEIEVKDLEELKKAAVSGADIILLDNMSLKMLRKCVRAARAIEKKRSKKILLEASGGITLENVRAVAKTGVDYISVGALTHSPKALDLSLEIVKCR
jgi:nicotinate-nucleotide pyrophosphorylase (carboxylating)